MEGRFPSIQRRLQWEKENRDKMSQTQDLYDLGQLILTERTNTTAYYIYTYLNQGEMDAARSEYRNDGDKLTAVFRIAIQKILGCRLHFSHDCKRFPCNLQCKSGIQEESMRAILDDMDRMQEAW